MSESHNNTRDRVAAVMKTEVFRLRHPKVWPAAIEEAALPAEVGGRIAEIVRRARLWNRESLDVAKELIAHAHAAIEKEVAPTEIVEGLGEPRPVARLIRRAVRRKRSWLWHTRVWLLRSIGGVVGAAVLLVVLVAARAWLGHPTPKRDFYAELNAPILKLDDDQKAWPLYKDAYQTIIQQSEAANELMKPRADQWLGREITDQQRELGVTYTGVEMANAITPDHPDYPAMLGLLQSLQPALDEIREGSTRPVIGRLVSSRVETRDSPEPGWIGDAIPESDDPAEQEFLIAALLPHLSPTRTFARWLVLDAEVALRTGDGERAARSIVAIFRIADQLEREPFLISGLVAYALDSIALKTVDEALESHADVWTRDDLALLAHELGAKRMTLERLPLDSEKMMFEDFLQRAFTDDGHGDGHITDEGIRLIRDMESVTDSDLDLGVESLISLVGLASRARQHDAYDSMMAAAREDEDAGYAIYQGRPRALALWEDRCLGRIDTALVQMLAPALGRCVDSENTLRVRFDATLTAVAMELYRRDTGDWPATPDELVPRYLPSAPADPFDGKPLKLTIREGRPVLYSIGPDLNDDGGDPGDVGPGKALRSTADTADPPRGDWVLFPPSARP
ncbi:MAG: hypothetical protein H6810_05315 [Phycisphaeraceae bacterium]|nr:MAG: hypothetical protein H6810_05315 [Phycisphaeraceae bacterium]